MRNEREIAEELFEDLTVLGRSSILREVVIGALSVAYTKGKLDERSRSFEELLKGGDSHVQAQEAQTKADPSRLLK